MFHHQFKNMSYLREFHDSVGICQGSNLQQNRNNYDGKNGEIILASVK